MLCPFSSHLFRTPTPPIPIHYIFLFPPYFLHLFNVRKVLKVEQQQPKLRCFLLRILSANALQALCLNCSSEAVDCVNGTQKVVVNVKIDKCLDGGCNGHGECREYIKSSDFIVFSSCACAAGKAGSSAWCLLLSSSFMSWSFAGHVRYIVIFGWSRFLCPAYLSHSCSWSEPMFLKLCRRT